MYNVWLVNVSIFFFFMLINKMVEIVDSEVVLVEIFILEVYFDNNDRCKFIVFYKVRLILWDVFLKLLKKVVKE